MMSFYLRLRAQAGQALSLTYGGQTCMLYGAAAFVIASAAGAGRQYWAFC